MKISEIQEGLPSPQEKIPEGLSKAEQLDEVPLFFRENPTSSRADFLALEKALGVTRDDLENLEFELCRSLCSKIGKNVNHGNENVDEAQLAKGIAHEMEHTNDEYIARLIALDHIYEMPDYYDKLQTIEND